jgi:hypothetical protein
LKLLLTIFLTYEKKLKTKSLKTEGSKSKIIFHFFNIDRPTCSNIYIYIYLYTVFFIFFVNILVLTK